MCEHSGSAESKILSSQATTIECTHERHRVRLGSREAGDGSHRDRERGKLGPERIGREMVASAASHVRRWHARLSQQNSRGTFCPYTGIHNIYI